MPRRLVLLLAILATSSVRADDFDRLEGKALAGVPENPAAMRRDQLTFGDLGTLPNILQGTRAALVVVKTDQANPARLLVAPALRKTPGAEGEPLPILVLERADTFEAGPATSRLAKARDVLLFDGYRYDLDTAQVVPEGQGGDIQFLASGEGGPRLVPVGEAKLFTLSQSPLSDATEPGQPSPGRAVVPEDFAGRFRLLGNGQWSGLLQVEIGENNVLTGRFRSDQTGTSYKVTGQVGVNAPQHMQFSIQYPRSRQDYDGYLWIGGKGAISGSVALLNQTYGFFAYREGGTFLPEEAEAPTLETGKENPPQRTLVALNARGKLRLNGQPIEPEALMDALKAARRRQ